jgi:hypothetical protein
MPRRRGRAASSLRAASSSRALRAGAFSTSAMPRSRRPSRSLPVITRFLSPHTRMRSSSITSSPGRSGLTFMRPSTLSSRVFGSVTMIGRCQ